MEQAEATFGGMLFINILWRIIISFVIVSIVNVPSLMKTEFLMPIWNSVCPALASLAALLRKASVRA